MSSVTPSRHHREAARETEPSMLSATAGQGGQSLHFWNIIEHWTTLCPDLLRRRTLFLKHTHTHTLSLV